MEHSTSAVNWQWVNIAKQPGEMHRNTLQHIARGADGACFFQWRQSLAGAEKFHSSMVPTPARISDIWRDVVQLGKHVESMAEVLGSTTRNDVAIILDYHAWWANELRTHPSAEVNYRENAYAYYAACWQLGIGVDFARPGSDLLAVPARHRSDAVCRGSRHRCLHRHVRAQRRTRACHVLFRHRRRPGPRDSWRLSRCVP